MSASLLEMRNITKQFPGVRALDGVDLEVRAGEVHCLLGQNGAGKSTLIRVLADVHHPDTGTIRWDSAETRFDRPTAAMKCGIATIYQELDLVDGLSVAENIFLGHEPARFGFNRRAQAQQASRVLLERLGHGEIPPGTAVGRLPAASRQIVSMARALSYDARLIVGPCARSRAATSRKPYRRRTDVTRQAPPPTRTHAALTCAPHSDGRCTAWRHAAVPRTPVPPSKGCGR